MGCKPCQEKWTEYYVKKGFSQSKAKKMAKNLLKRVDKRLKKENKSYEPMYLIERAGEGILLYRKKAKGRFEQWVFDTNWKATFLWSFLKKRLIWIGKGGNSPYDYTQVCNDDCAVATGSCGAGLPCTVASDCRKNFTCTSTCPAALAHSSLTLNACVCGELGCTWVSKKCSGANPSCTVVVSGDCEYTCDPGYTWNGVACAVPTAAVTPQGDGLVWIRVGMLKKVFRIITESK